MAQGMSTVGMKGGICSLSNQWIKRTDFLRLASDRPVKNLLMSKVLCWELRGRAGLVPWARGSLMLLFSLPKRSIPKPDQRRKYIIQQESLGTDML